jgi:hypothetical protein
MADNVTVTEGTGTTIAADEIAGVKHQRVKIQHGADGSATDVSSASPLPISDAGGSLTVDGTVTANLAPTTSGGLSIYKNLDLDETGVSVKGSAGQLYGWFIYNNATSTRYVKLYNVSSAPTVGTTTPVFTLPIPAGAAANVAFPNGIAFDTGIGLGAVTGVADNSTGAPSANDVTITLFYK